MANPTAPSTSFRVVNPLQHPHYLQWQFNIYFVPRKLCDRGSTRARVCVWVRFEQDEYQRIVMYIWSDCSFVWVKRFRVQSHAVILAVLGNLDSRILISLSWAEGVKPVRTSRRVSDDVSVVVGEGTTWANKNGDSALTSWCRPWLGHLHTGSSLRQLRFVTDYCQRASHCCSQANIL